MANAILQRTSVCGFIVVFWMCILKTRQLDIRKTADIRFLTVKEAP